METKNTAERKNDWQAWCSVLNGFRRPQMHYHYYRETLANWWVRRQEEKGQC